MTIRDKTTMYELLASGRLGNHTPQWFSVAEWERDPARPDVPLWGVRSALAGGCPKSRLDVPTAEVGPLFREWFGGSGGNISPMVDHMMTARFQVWDGFRGLYVWAVVGHTGLKWRPAFASVSTHHEGTAARQLLRRHLNENSYHDVEELFEKYPGHVVEMTALDRCFGLVPGRNAVVWEVRDY